MQILLRAFESYADNYYLFGIYEKEVKIIINAVQGVVFISREIRKLAAETSFCSTSKGTTLPLNYGKEIAIPMPIDEIGLSKKR